MSVQGQPTLERRLTALARFKHEHFKAMSTPFFGLTSRLTELSVGSPLCPIYQDDHEGTKKKKTEKTEDLVFVSKDLKSYVQHVISANAQNIS